MSSLCLDSDLMVFANALWQPPYQGIHQLVSRYSMHRRVYFIQPTVRSGDYSCFMETKYQSGVTILTPHEPVRMPQFERTELTRSLLNDFIAEEDIKRCSFWYTDPNALRYSDHIQPQLTVYDSYSENSISQKTSCDEYERILLNTADMVFMPQLRSSTPTGHARMHTFLQAPAGEDHDTDMWNQIWQQMANLENNSIFKKSKGSAPYFAPK